MGKVKGIILLSFIALIAVLSFQNCSGDSAVFSSDRSKQKESSSSNGHGYDGKLYSHVDKENPCDNGSPIINQIEVIDETARLVIEDCKEIKPKEIAASEYTLAGDILIYMGTTFVLDDCVSGVTTAVGSQCLSGAIYAGEFQYGGSIGSMKIMVTPGNCSSSPQPLCDGADDSLMLGWGNRGVITDLKEQKEGQENTIELVEVWGPSPAAQFCYDLEYAGYNDWYLPALDELRHVLDLAEGGSLPGFRPDPYWSSNEEGDVRGHARSFGGNRDQIDKDSPQYVRCIRKY